MSKIGVDVRLTKRMSVGMKLYTNALHEELPHVAPQHAFRFFENDGNLNVTEQIAMPAQSLVERIDCVHYTTNFGGILTPRPFAVTIHDLHFIKFPGLLSESMRRIFTVYTRWLAKRAAAVIVDDERTIDDCERYLGIDCAKCHVIPLGYSPSILSGDIPKSRRPYFLYAGNHSPHKLVDQLVAAWNGLPTSMEIDLYLTGARDERLVAMIDSKKTREVRFLGTIPEEALWDYFRGATAYVHPALAEGFGLPMLEAMAIGTPVIATEESVPLRLMPVAATYPARDADALRALLVDAVHSSAQYAARAARALEIARPLTWSECARETARLYERVLL